MCEKVRWGHEIVSGGVHERVRGGVHEKVRGGMYMGGLEVLNGVYMFSRYTYKYNTQTTHTRTFVRIHAYKHTYMRIVRRLNLLYSQLHTYQYKQTCTPIQTYKPINTH